MTQIKTAELQGAALDYAVTVCEGRTWEAVESFITYHDDGEMNYSTNWAQGGPIIEREEIDLSFYLRYVEASKRSVKFSTVRGFAPLVAAMRCYVASKLGETVEIPDDLL